MDELQAVSKVGAALKLYHKCFQGVSVCLSLGQPQGFFFAECEVINVNKSLLEIFFCKMLSDERQGEVDMGDVAVQHNFAPGDVSDERAVVNGIHEPPEGIVHFCLVEIRNLSEEFRRQELDVVYKFFTLFLGENISSLSSFHCIGILSSSAGKD